MTPFKKLTDQLRPLLARSLFEFRFSFIRLIALAVAKLIKIDASQQQTKIPIEPKIYKVCRETLLESILDKPAVKVNSLWLAVNNVGSFLPLLDFR